MISSSDYFSSFSYFYSAYRKLNSFALCFCIKRDKHLPQNDCWIYGQYEGTFQKLLCFYFVLSQLFLKNILKQIFDIIIVLRKLQRTFVRKNFVHLYLQQRIQGNLIDAYILDHHRIKVFLIWVNIILNFNFWMCFLNVCFHRKRVYSLDNHSEVLP